MKLCLLSPQSLGTVIKDVRIKKGWTQAELGRQVHMHQKDISILEHNSGNTKLSRLLAICAMLGLKMIIEDDADPTVNEDMW